MDFVTIYAKSHTAQNAMFRAAENVQPYSIPPLCQKYYKKITLAQFLLTQGPGLAKMVNVN